MKVATVKNGVFIFKNDLILWISDLLLQSLNLDCSPHQLEGKGNCNVTF